MDQHIDYLKSIEPERVECFYNILDCMALNPDYINHVVGAYVDNASEEELEAWQQLLKFEQESRDV